MVNIHQSLRPSFQKKSTFRRTLTPITFLRRRVAHENTFQDTRVQFTNIISIIMHKQTHPKTLRETTKSLKPNKHLQEFYNQEHKEAYDL
jgi:hypothetical protein